MFAFIKSTEYFLKFALYNGFWKVKQITVPQSELWKHSCSSSPLIVKDHRRRPREWGGKCEPKAKH